MCRRSAAFGTANSTTKSTSPQGLKPPAVLARRKQEFTPAQERLLRHVFKLTQAEREAALHRSREKRRAVPVT